MEIQCDAELLQSCCNICAGLRCDCTETRLATCCNRILVQSRRIVCAGLNLLNRPKKNQLGHACHFYEQRPQSWIFPKRYQVQGHILPFVPSCSNTNFCVLIDIWVYFIGLPEKFCYRNVQWLIFAVKNGHKNPKIDQKWQSWFKA